MGVVWKLDCWEIYILILIRKKKSQTKCIVRKKLKQTWVITLSKIWILDYLKIAQKTPPKKQLVKNTIGSGPIIFRPCLSNMSYIDFSYGDKFCCFPLFCRSFVSSSFVLLTGWSFSMGSAYQFHSWRVFVVVCALPCVCAVVALTFMPESPRFYLEVKDFAIEIELKHVLN